MKLQLLTLKYLLLLFLSLFLMIDANAVTKTADVKHGIQHQQKKLSLKERIALKILKKRIKKAQKKAAKSNPGGSGFLPKLRDQEQKVKKEKKTKKSNSEGSELFSGVGKILLGALGVVLGVLLLVGGLFTLSIWGLIRGFGFIGLGALGILSGAWAILD